MATYTNLRGLAAVILIALALLTGCAIRKAQVVARSDVPLVVATTNTFAIANHPTPVAGDDALKRDLVRELNRAGFQLTTATNADYTIVYWIEEGWRTTRGGGPQFGYAGGPIPMGGPMLAGQYGSYEQVRPGFYGNPYRDYGMDVERPLPSQGIHLQLYTRDDLRAGRLQRAWEGFIDAGFTVTPEREPFLLRTLIAYFGKDHVGKVKIDGLP